MGKRTLRLASNYGMTAKKRLYSKATKAGKLRRKELASKVRSHRNSLGYFGGNSISSELAYGKRSNKRRGVVRMMKLGRYIQKRIVRKMNG